MSDTDPAACMRPAVFGDVETIFRLIKEHPQQLVPRPISDIVMNIDRFLVCAIDNEIAGCVSWQILPEVGVSKQHDVEIISLVVADRFKGGGVGRTLVKSAIERIRPLCPSEIIVLTFTPGFFSKLGFEVVAKETLIHKIYIGCINCTRYDSPFTCPEVAMRMLLR